MDFAANVHFRTVVGSHDRKHGFRGGYGWFFGRYPTLESFKAALADHFKPKGWVIEEWVMIIELSGIRDLDSDEQQTLYRLLDDHPIQYRTVHMYSNDDA